MAAKPKVDFMAIHWYGGTNAKSFLAHIDSVYAKYGKPIWVTEFASADWTGGNPGGYPIEEVKAFIKAATAGLD